MKHPIALSFFLASALVAGNAGAADDTAAQCQKLLDAYGEIQVSAKQSQLTAQVQAGIVQVCKRLIEAEQPKPTPTPVVEAEKK